MQPDTSHFLISLRMDMSCSGGPKMYGNCRVTCAFTQQNAVVISCFIICLPEHNFLFKIITHCVVQTYWRLHLADLGCGKLTAMRMQNFDE